MLVSTVVLITTVIWVLMILKHFIWDFALQYPRHYLNKGFYGRWGGIEHALLHGFATGCILSPWYGVADAIIHYHIDWAKMKFNRHMDWKPDNSEHFWTLLGVDQMLHYLTYAVLICLYLGGIQ
jgi:hypothetical protein